MGVRILPTELIREWCNGNTTGFGPVIGGSNPSSRAMYVKIELTDSEWMSVLDQTRDGLPYCCANISALRDDLFNIVRYGCEMAQWNILSFFTHYKWVKDGHELNSPALNKIFDQLMQNEHCAKMWEAVEEHAREKEIV